MIRRRFKYFMPERNEFSTTGEETLLSVSEYYGVKPRSEAFDTDAAESRAESLKGYRKVRAGDFVMNYMLAWKGAYGVSEYDGIVSPAYAVYKIDPRYADRRFIHHRLRSEHMRSVFRARSKGIIESRLRLYPDAFLSMELELPDLETQKAIANFLDRETARIDQLIEKKLALVEALQERDNGLARRLLSGELSDGRSRTTTSTPWLQSVPNHWEIAPLRHLAKISTGGRDTQDRTDDGAYPFYVRSMNVERIDTYSYDEEAVLTSGDGAGVGKVFHHVRGKFELHQRMYAFTRFKRVSGRYFFHFLKTFFHLQMTQWSAKSTVDSVRMPFLKCMLFAVPPRDEQEALLTRIDTSLQRTEQIVDATEKSIDRLREFRSALITSAVNGQIDVTTWGKRGETDRRLDKIEEDMAAPRAAGQVEARV